MTAGQGARDTFFFFPGPTLELPAPPKGAGRPQGVSWSEKMRCQGFQFLREKRWLPLAGGQPSRYGDA